MIGALLTIVGMTTQVLAYRASPDSVTRPIQCLIWPFGGCELVLDSGYRGLCQQIGWDAPDFVIGAGPFAALGLALIGVIMVIYREDEA